MDLAWSWAIIKVYIYLKTQKAGSVATLDAIGITSSKTIHVGLRP